MDVLTDALNTARDIASEHSTDALLVCTALSIISCFLAVLTKAAATMRANRLAARVSEIERSLASLQAEEARRLVLDIRGSTRANPNHDTGPVQTAGTPPHSHEPLRTQGSAQL